MSVLEGVMCIYSSLCVSCSWLCLLVRLARSGCSPVLFDKDAHSSACRSSC